MDNMSKAGRNDPCPCGSGKKYKKCCLMDVFIPAGKEDSIKKRLVQELLGFSRKTLGMDKLDEAASRFWGDLDPAQFLDEEGLRISDINYWEWMVFDWHDDDDGKSLIEKYIGKSILLSVDDLAMLAKMKRAVLSLYEVQEVFPEKGFLLKDLLRGDEYDVTEKAATSYLRKWDVFAARLLQLDGQCIMTGSAYPFPIRLKSAIIKDIMLEYKIFKKEYPESGMDDFLKQNGEMFNFYWSDLIKNPPKPTITNTDKEIFVISKAYYHIKNTDDVKAALRAIGEFKEDKNSECFTWYSKKKPDFGSTILGNITFNGKTLTLECNSKQRLKRGRKMIENSVAGIVHKADMFEDIDQCLKAMKDNPVEKPKDLPLEITQQLYTQFMDRHSKRWINMKIPALGGKTPRQAVKTKAGREKVQELLKSFENKEEHNRREGEPFYDLAWMWAELGIDGEE